MIPSYLLSKTTHAFLLAAAVGAALWTGGCASRETGKQTRPASPPSSAAPSARTGRAPADHTKDKDGVRHKPGYKQPEGVCNPCHGARLEGSSKAPSCTSCHEREWD